MFLRAVCRGADFVHARQLFLDRHGLRPAAAAVVAGRLVRGAHPPSALSCQVLELADLERSHRGRAGASGQPGGVCVLEIPLPRAGTAVFHRHHRHDDALPGHAGVQLLCHPRPGADGLVGGAHHPGSVLAVRRVFAAPGVRHLPRRAAGRRAHRRRGRFDDPVPHPAAAQPGGRRVAGIADLCGRLEHGGAAAGVP